MPGSDISAITKNTIFSSIVGLFICWFTMPFWQIGGTVIAYAVYVILQLLFYYFYYWPRVMKINSWKIFSESFMPYVIAGSGIAILSHYIHFDMPIIVSFFVKGCIFLLLYLILILYLLKPEDKRFFLNLIKR